MKFYQNMERIPFTTRSTEINDNDEEGVQTVDKDINNLKPIMALFQKFICKLFVQQINRNNFNPRDFYLTILDDDMWTMVNWFRGESEAHRGAVLFAIICITFQIVPVP